MADKIDRPDVTYKTLDLTIRGKAVSVDIPLSARPCQIKGLRKGLEIIGTLDLNPFGEYSFEEIKVTQFCNSVGLPSFLEVQTTVGSKGAPSIKTRRQFFVSSGGGLSAHQGQKSKSRGPNSIYFNSLVGAY
jgi:hypothetical protein